LGSLQEDELKFKFCSRRGAVKDKIELHFSFSALFLAERILLAGHASANGAISRRAIPRADAPFHA